MANIDVIKQGLAQQNNYNGAKIVVHNPTANGCCIREICAGEQRYPFDVSRTDSAWGQRQPMQKGTGNLW